MRRAWRDEETQKVLEKYFNITCGFCGEDRVLCEREHDLQEQEDSPGKLVEGFEISAEDENIRNKGFGPALEGLLENLNPALCAECYQVVGKIYEKIAQAIKTADVQELRNALVILVLCWTDLKLEKEQKKLEELVRERMGQLRHPIKTILTILKEGA